MESWRHVWRVETICRVMQVSPRGYRAWRSRPVSQRARTDMRVLAHNRFDNASVETFFKSLKAELIWRQNWPTRRQAEAAIFQYINGFYNTRRRHSYLGGISPLAFEAKVA